MSEWVTRAQIGLRKAKAAYALVPSQVKNVAFHYPGTPKPINAVGDAGFRRVCSALRGWQAYHMDTRGWSDIAYETAIDQVGRKYTLRGVNIRSAANGGTQVNLEYGAILLVLGNNEAPSAAMEATAREVVQEYRNRYSRIPKRPTWHGAIRPGGTASDPSTSCPGKLTIAEIKGGKFDAGTAPTPDVHPDPDQPSVSLAACVYTAQHNGQYLPNGADDSLNVKAYLVRHGYALATDSWRTAYQKFQRHLGYDGADADGIPGKTSLGILCKSANWRLVP